jgi:hypothetical protein
MGCMIQWHCDHCGTMRIGRDLREHGDPYQFACTVVRHGRTIVAHGGVSSERIDFAGERRSIVRELLRPLGIKRVRWSRLRDGKEIWREFPV